VPVFVIEAGPGWTLGATPKWGGLFLDAYSATDLLTFGKALIAADGDAAPQPGALIAGAMRSKHRRAMGGSTFSRSRTVRATAWGPLTGGAA
jgi:hypothetical protein